MASVRIDFQEGFKDDEVVLVLDDREVSRLQDVRTKLALGYAGHHEIQITPGGHVLRIFLPKRNLSTTIDLPTAEKVFVGASVRGAGIVHIVSAKPFGYG